MYGNEQRVAFSIFECIRTRFTHVLTTFKVTFVSTTVSATHTRDELLICVPDSLSRSPLFSSPYDPRCYCGCTHTAASGQIVASGRCKGLATWIIQAKPGLQVTLTFRYYDIAHKWQWIKVRDGRTAEDELLFSSDEVSRPANITSSSNIMRVELMTRRGMVSQTEAAVFPQNATLPIHVRGFIAAYSARGVWTAVEREREREGGVERGGGGRDGKSLWEERERERDIFWSMIILETNDLKNNRPKRRTLHSIGDEGKKKVLTIGKAAHTHTSVSITPSLPFLLSPLFELGSQSLGELLLPPPSPFHSFPRGAMSPRSRPTTCLCLGHYWNGGQL